MTRDDADRLDRALDRPPGARRDDLPDLTAELLAVADQVADALAAPLLSASQRERLYRRAVAGAVVARPGMWRRIGRFGRRPEVVGAAAAVAAATATAVAVAVLRGRAAQRATAAA